MSFVSMSFLTFLTRALMRKRRQRPMGLGFLLGFCLLRAAEAWGCGPYFDASLLMDRERTVGTLIDAQFIDYAHLILLKAPHTLKSGADQPPSSPEYKRYFELGEEALKLFRGDEEAKAVSLYAEQALQEWRSWQSWKSHDERPSGGHNSLLYAARLILGNDMRLQQTLEDPVVGRLLVLFAYTRGGFGTMDREIQTMLSQLIEKRIYPAPDVFAAALYRYGRIDEAQQVLRRGNPKQQMIPGLAPWLKAKFALYEGHWPAVEKWLKEAITQLPPNLQPRAHGELATLLMRRGAYQEALSHMIASHYSWDDVTYIAEYVLTSEELLTFLSEENATQTCRYSPAEPPSEDPHDPNYCLDMVAARRLVREGRYLNAAHLFELAQSPALAQVARALAQSRAIVESKENIPAITRAEQLFAMATQYEHVNMPLAGTAWAPDWSNYEGYYIVTDEPPRSFSEETQAREDGDYSEDASYEDDDDYEKGIVPRREDSDEREFASVVRDIGGMQSQNRSMTNAQWKLMSEDELKRAQAHLPTPNKRFHYREQAAQWAAQAAKWVPARSQAYAALMCHAIRWSRRDEAARAALYAEYVKKGALVSFSVDNGPCPQPNFQSAKALEERLAHQTWAQKVGLSQWLQNLRIRLRTLWASIKK